MLMCFYLFFVNGSIFSFQSQSYILRVLLKIHKTFSYNLPHDIKYACFPYDQMTKLLTLNIRKQYAHLFVAEDFSGLLAHPSIFLINDSMSA